MSNEDRNDPTPNCSVSEWRAQRAKPANDPVPQPASTAVATPQKTLADRIHARRESPPATDQGGGESGGDDGQQQTVARTNLFTTLGVRMENAGQDIQTPAPLKARDPMDRPVQDMGNLLKVPTPTKKRKHGF